ncbi:hypothetical protein Vafri_11506 [Volvox africanus]|nr:hypothetical protein Vafri_11506 [Volvox africanus]
MESLGDGRPCFATKAATAAKRLQGAAARCEANHARAILNRDGSEVVGCAGNAPAFVTAIAGAQVARPPVAPGAGICRAGGNIVGHTTGAGSNSTTGRTRLPGLRTLNGLGTSGSANAHRLGAALPLLLACTRGGGLESQDSAVIAAPGRVPSMWRTSALASEAAPRVFMSVPPTRSSHLSLTPGAFLPSHATARMPPSNTSRQQAANPGMPVGSPDGIINHGASTNHGGSEDGACKGENGVNPPLDSASAAGAEAAAPSPRSGRGCSTRNAVANLCSSYKTSTAALRLRQARRQENGTAGDPWGRNGSDGAGGGDSHGSGAYDSDYSSARSSESKTEEADDYELKSPKRRRVEGNGERPLITGAATAAISTTASAGATGSMRAAAAPPQGACDGAMVSAGRDIVNAAAALEPTGAMAAVPVDSAPSGRCTNYSYGPPWALMPRSGRVGELRCSLRAAQMFWPTLFEAARREPQLVVLDVVVPSDGVHSGFSGELSRSGVATVAVRALLRHDDKTMLLRPVEELPLGLCASVPVLLQISPHPNGEGAVVQLANRHVWAYYRARGGKICCPGRLDASAAMAQTNGCSDSYDDSYVLQIRLGANLFGNRSFDVGIRAAERLFGHLVPGVQGVACAETGAGAPGDGGCTDGRVAAASGLRQANADAADSSGGGGSAANGLEALGAVAANANGNGRDPSRATRTGSFKTADGGVDGENRGGNGMSTRACEIRGGGRSTVAAGRATCGPLPIHSLVVTVIAEAWPEARSKVEFRYRFPRLLGMPNNAHHAYATLGSNLVAPMVLYGAQPGDVFEMWRRPGGAPEEFLCRVARSVVRGGKKRHVAKGNGGARDGVCVAQGLEVAEAVCEH